MLLGSPSYHVTYDWLSTQSVRGPSGRWSRDITTWIKWFKVNTSADILFVLIQARSQLGLSDSKLTLQQIYCSTWSGISGILPRPRGICPLRVIWNYIEGLCRDSLKGLGGTERSNFCGIWVISFSHRFPLCSVGQLIKMTEDGRKVNDPHCPN